MKPSPLTPLLTLLLAPLTTALPSATPIPVAYPGTCTSWPNWIRTPSADVTGDIQLLISTPDEASASNLLFRYFSVPWGGLQREQLGADFRPSSYYTSSSYFRCKNGNITHGNSVARISTNSNAAQLLVDAREATYAAELYYLEVDGKRLDGVYLGARNQTTWGFYYQEPTCGGSGGATKDFIAAKLLNLPVDEANPPSAAPAAQFEGFIKVVSA
ncbi:hypothetical protein CC80DRAFT_531257 [Byssothecium circinans]|uniref:Uncharacterized protein n=1 Tax=Byssothecium circinans TaxID=147558 RepID=A0A6A5UDF5_9PLEO|nr:hypothetical protein CC80DRAFT_531257 [Byssothecium circinans]